MCEGEGFYTGYIGRKEKKTETTGVIGVIYGSYIGIMEQKMETSGGGFGYLKCRKLRTLRRRGAHFPRTFHLPDFCAVRSFRVVLA